MSARFLVIDIESKRDAAFFEEHGEAIFAKVEPAGNLKDPVKIAADIEEKRQAIFDKAGLNPLLGRIVAIGIGDLHGDDPPTVFASDEEREVLEQFCAAVHALDTDVGYAGFNIRSFDLPFLALRLAMHGLDWPGHYPAKNDYRRIVDPTDLWRSSTSGGGHLDLFLRAFDLPTKTADGAAVEGMTIAEVAAYNANDVVCERLLVRKLAHLFPSLGALR